MSTKYLNYNSSVPNIYFEGMLIMLINQWRLIKWLVLLCFYVSRPSAIQFLRR